MNRTGGALAMGAAGAVLLFAVAAHAQTTPETPSVETAEAVDSTTEPEPEPAPEPPPPPAPPPTVSDAIAAGKLILEARARYETVDQRKTAILTEDAEAMTLRTRLGWETGDWNGLKGLIEFEDVRQIGPERYAVNVPGAATPPLNGADNAKYPVVNDPDVTELNRLQLSWTPSAAASFTAGRQRIVIGDQRFVGNVGWRQDEQTFDAVRADLAFGRFKATYAYVTHVNRILGELRDWDSDSHLLSVTWSPAEAFRLEGFVYALDFENSLANTSITKGAKVSGKTWLGLYQVAYNATWARQGDYHDATAPYELDYRSADIAGTFDIWTVKLAYEALEGNGTRGFTTPLATTHAFNGWSDAFVQAAGGNKGFVDGLEDFNVSVNIKPRLRFTYLSAIDLTLRYHDFDDERTGADLGDEWDAQVQAAITPKLTAAFKYADFDRERTVPLGTATPPASRTKVWFTLEYKL